jgi:PAS domain S-box-containing protein
LSPIVRSSRDCVPYVTHGARLRSQPSGERSGSMPKRLPIAAHIYLWSVIGAAAALLTYWLRAWTGPSTPDLRLAAVLAALGVAAQHFTVHVGPQRKIDAAIGVYVAALFLLGAPAAMLVVGASQLVGQGTLVLRRNPTTGMRRRSARSVLFNAGQFALATGLAGLVYYSQLPHTAPVTLQRQENLWAVPAAAATLYLANSLAVAGIVGLQRGQNLIQVWLTGRQSTAAEVAVLVLIGLAGVYASTGAPWLTPALALSALVVYLSLKRAAQVAEQARLLRESEARYRTLVEMAPDVIFSIAAEDGTLSTLSPSFGRSTGWTVEEWLGKPFAGLVHPDDASRAAAAFERALRGEALPPYEIRVLSKDGGHRVAEITTAPRVEDGTVTGVFGIARDVTDRQRLEDERVSLRASLARLQERERIAMDLHDGAIQSLYAVALGLGTQERTPDRRPDEARRAMRAARLQIDRVIQELRNYLYDLPLQNLGEHQLLEGLQTLAEELRVNALIRPELDVAVEPGAECRLDQETVRSVLQITREATSNVIRHAAASKVTIRLAQSDPHRLRLTIRDNGRGFDLAASCADSSGDDHTHGQGLRNMATRAEMLGGCLTVRSQPGHGTEIHLDVPLEHVAYEEVA